MCRDAEPGLIGGAAHRLSWGDLERDAGPGVGLGASRMASMSPTEPMRIIGVACCRETRARDLAEFECGPGARGPEGGRMGMGEAAGSEARGGWRWAQLGGAG